MQGLDWNDLRAFLAIAESGQIGRAASLLQVDATTLGRRLKRLEDSLEVTLFERTRQGQTLTEAGERLLEKVELMGESARAISADEEARKGLAGTLRISVSEGFGTEFLTRYLPDFSRRHPHLTVELVANSGFLSPSKREADISVMLSRPKAGPVLSQKLADYHLGLYASADYLSQKGEPQAADDLAEGHSFVSYVPDLLYAPELNYLDEILPGLSAQMRSSSINAQLRLVQGGAGIGVLPGFLAKRAGLTRILPPKRIERSFWLVTHADTRNLARIRAGKAWLIECVDAGRSELTLD